MDKRHFVFAFACLSVFLGATGTPSNDLACRINQLERCGEMDAVEALQDSIVSAAETGILALYLADDHGPTAAQGLGALDRLSGIPGMLIIDGETGAIIFRDRTKDIAEAVSALFQ